MEAVFSIVALLFVFALVLGVYATVKAVGAAKRSVDRGITQARRTVEDHTLRAKSFAQPGPVGELARLRLSLRTSMRATQDALHAGVAEDASLRESLALFERLSAHGFELDGELRRLEADPDRATLAERLPSLRERTERITRSAESLRWAARDRARRFADDDLDTLSAQIDVEAGALRHWTTTEEQPGVAAPGAAGTRDASGPTLAEPPGAATPPWPAAPEADSAAARQSWPEPSATPTVPDPAAPQAIAPPTPSPTYPWLKKPRPERAPGS
ncbi:hypothetical protein ACGFZL_02055 [Streptomyces sp. NPDC048182]|uniref:hypothetical protein n=1 Tax=unclassified Streptomyces TaxID=2593676 RepID=UPI0033BD02D3